MAEDKEQKEQIYIIPKNFTSFVTASELIKSRNLIEACVATLLVYEGLGHIPFVTELKVAIIVISCIICFLVFLVGYKEESITSYLEGYFKYKLSSGVRRIRIPNEHNHIKQDENSGEGEEYKSYYEKLVEKIKHR